MLSGPTPGPRPPRRSAQSGFAVSSGAFTGSGLIFDFREATSTCVDVSGKRSGFEHCAIGSTDQILYAPGVGQSECRGKLLKSGRCRLAHQPGSQAATHLAATLSAEVHRFKVKMLRHCCQHRRVIATPQPTRWRDTAGVTRTLDSRPHLFEDLRAAE
jgi:hypothetical protein